VGDPRRAAGRHGGALTMADAGWLLRRLAAMSPGEVAHRARVALRDRVAPPRWTALAPTAAFRVLFEGDGVRALRESRIRTWITVPVPAHGFAAEVHAARRALEGRWTLFGREVAIEDRPRWNRNPLTGAEWPDAPSADLDHRRTDLAGGAKYTWELGRLTLLPTLALAARLTGDDAPARIAARWLDDWNQKNPLGRGLHHTSGIEMAVRIFTVSATLALLGDEGPRPDPEATLGLLAQQALWCGNHLSLGSSANNHLLAELAAVVAIGSLYPTLRGGAGRADRALRQLEAEVLAQFHPDGVSAEQSFGYLPFIGELLLLAFTAAERSGRRVAPAVRERLAAALEFARVTRLPGGGWPQVGDEDDGRILLASDTGSRMDLVMNALAAWVSRPPLSDDATGLRTLLGLKPGPAARAANEGVHAFAYGGWTVWRERGVLLTFDHGPLGLGSIAAHGHADALGLTLFRGDDGLIVDPGTLAYQEDAAARDASRGTPAHSTLHFGGRSQSEMRGPFLWGRRADVTREGESWVCTWWTGERHKRRVTFQHPVVTVEDQVEGEHAELVWTLAPGAQAVIEGTRAIVRNGASRMELQAEGVLPLRLEPSEHGVRFGQRVPAARLCALLRGPRATTRIRVGEA